MKHYSDDEIKQRLMSDKERIVDEALYYLHTRVYPKVVGFVKKYKGTLNDAEDAFQESLLILYKLARQGKLEECSNMEAYLMAINRNVWFKLLKKRKETVDITEETNAISVPPVALFSLIQDDKSNSFDNVLASLGESCQKLLVHYYYDRLRMKEIAELLGFANEQVAKNKKSKCLQQLKVLLEKLPHYKDNLT